MLIGLNEDGEVLIVPGPGNTEGIWVLGTEDDFVEAPSQILEHSISQPDVLDRFGAHYETGERIPREMLAGMVVDLVHHNLADIPEPPASLSTATPTEQLWMPLTASSPAKTPPS